MNAVQEINLTREDRQISAALGDAVREALLMHKRAGNAIAVWRDGKVVEIPAEDIVVPEKRNDAEE